jgi:outer membrane protein assembly factor BamD (BamD/ComL family)
MSIAGILSSALFSSGSSAVQGAQSKAKSFQTEFQQLGQDLQSGNTASAQADVTALQQLAPPASSSQSTSPIAQAFNQLSQDLKAGNTTAAQSDFTTIQQDVQTQASQAQGHHHHHHGGGGGSNNNVTQLLDQLGQELQSGDLSGAQSAYGTLAQSFPDLQSGASGVSFSA